MLFQPSLFLFTDEASMVIKNEYDLGQTVYLKTDTEQLPRIVYGIEIRIGGSLTYNVSCGTEISEHYGIELAKEKDALLAVGA